MPSKRIAGTTRCGGCWGPKGRKLEQRALRLGQPEDEPSGSRQIAKRPNLAGEATQAPARDPEPLTCELTLEQLWRARFLHMWRPCDGRAPRRKFFYSTDWKKSLDEFPRQANRGRLRSFPLTGDDVEPGEGSGGWVDFEFYDLSPRGRVAGLVESFVVGLPKSDLCYPQGFGSEPLFERMRAPRAESVEMRTSKTRTFGFFSGHNAFVAVSLDLLERLHATTGLHEWHGDRVLKITNGLASAESDGLSNIDELIGD